MLTGYLERQFTGALRSIRRSSDGRVGVLAYIATIVGFALIFQGIRSAVVKPPTENGSPETGRLNCGFLPAAAAPPRSRAGVDHCAGSMIAVVVLAIFRPAFYAAAVLVGLAASLVIAVGLITSILIYIGGFRRHGFGLIPGTTTRRKRSLLGVMAGIPNRRLRNRSCPG